MSKWIKKIINNKYFIYTMSFWPPYWGTGIWIKKVSEDFCYIKVIMKQKFWNTNYMGTHFGGSMYMMIDPFYMLMLNMNLGENYYVWDKMAEIDYIRRGYGTLSVEFNLTKKYLENLREKLQKEKTRTEKFELLIKNDKEVVAKVIKTVYIRNAS